MGQREGSGRPDGTELDAGWLISRRWFRSKARAVAEVEPVDEADLGGDCLLLVLGVTYADGAEDRYQVLAVRDGGTLREARDGDGAWRALLLRVLDGATIRGRHGAFECHPTPELERIVTDDDSHPETLAETVFAGEQSNTSVRLGDRLILKLYRRLEDGINPEVEVNGFLSAAGFTHAPALAGSITYRDRRGVEASAAMVQEAVAARGDGWSWTAARLRTPPDGPVEAIAGASIIGGITAAMHRALASRPRDPAFPARPATADERGRWQADAQRMLDRALQSLTGAQHERLVAVEAAVRGRMAAIGAAQDAYLQRIHGDYHLGQLLRTASSFCVIDFEGEPARDLDERRAPASPLRDVAGMLRSLDYAARTAEREAPPGTDLRAWVSDARRAFVTAYGDDHLDAALLDALELEKACYEVAYEANNRPEWTWLPLEAIERIVAASA